MIAEKKIDELANLWKQFFEEEIGVEHMTMLLEHVDAFFTDIIVETENRGKAIKEKIDSKLKYQNLTGFDLIVYEFKA